VLAGLGQTLPTTGFVRLAKIEKYSPSIWNTPDNRLSNAAWRATNTRLEGN